MRTDPTNSGCADSIGQSDGKGLVCLVRDTAKVGESAKPEQFHNVLAVRIRSSFLAKASFGSKKLGQDTSARFRKYPPSDIALVVQPGIGQDLKKAAGGPAFGVQRAEDNARNP